MQKLAFLALSGFEGLVSSQESVWPFKDNNWQTESSVPITRCVLGINCNGNFQINPHGEAMALRWNLLDGSSVDADTNKSCFDRHLLTASFINRAGVKVTTTAAEDLTGF